MKRPTLKKLAKIAGIAFAVFIVLLLIVSKSIDWICIAPEPELQGTPEILSQNLQTSGARKILASSWVEKRHGILQMYLTGSPFAMGWSNATLTSDLIKEQEDSLIATVDKFVPGYFRKLLLGKIVLVMNRRLPEYVSEEFKMEVLGLSRGFTDYHPEIAPLYHRLLNYHAAHDISHAVMDNPLVGCTSFAAWGQHTVDGKLIVARNFDFEAGECFDINKVVVLLRPEKGYAFISVTWPGMLGVVTGINEKRIYLSINAGRTDDRKMIGTPVCFVARQVLQYAADLEEARVIVEAAQVFVSDSFLIADGKTGQAIVIEKSPEKTALRQPEGEYIICSNHFMEPDFAKDQANADYMTSGTTLARYQRMENLVKGTSANLDPPLAASFLRDRLGKDNLNIGNGNRSAINPLIATHSVVADVTNGIIWVSTPPHQLGKFVPFSIENFDKIREEQIIPEDAFLSGGYAELIESRKLLDLGTELLKSGESVAARPLLEKSSRLNPEYYMPYILLAQIAIKEGRLAEANKLLVSGEEKQPAFGKDRREIRRLGKQIMTAFSKGE
jgi:isopenicillin-N N-acyltransferase like protein